MSTFEERHRELRRAAGRSSPVADEVAEVEEKRLRWFYSSTGPLTGDGIAAAREMLKFGAHDGPCEPMADGRCRLHTEALDRRQQALMDALARLDEVASW